MNHRILCTALLVSAVSAGCGSVQTPDEPGSFTVHCNKSDLRWNACYETAANLCGESGYQIVSEDGGTLPVVTANSNEVPVIGGSMVIRCNQ